MTGSDLGEGRTNRSPANDPANDPAEAFGSPPQQIGLVRLLGRGCRLACAACGRRKHFRRWFWMADCCHNCGFVFNRIEGHWSGAIGLNTIVSFSVLFVSLMVSMGLTIPDIPVVPLTIGNVALALIFPLVFFPFSRMIWTSIDVAMRPLEAHEADWTKLRSSSNARVENH